MATHEHRNGIRASLFWVLLIIGLIAVVGRQWQLNARLGRENQSLQEQLKAFEDTRNENVELQSERDRLRRFQDSEAQQIQVLRADIQKLRQRTNVIDSTWLTQRLGLTDAQMRAFLELAQKEVEKATAQEQAESYLRATRPAVWLGLNDIRDIRPQDHNPYARTGVFIGAVVPGGPAEKAKVQAGDLVVGVDGHAITGVVILKSILLQKAAGETVALDVARLDSLGQETVMRVDVVPSNWPK